MFDELWTRIAFDFLAVGILFSSGVLVALSSAEPTVPDNRRHL